MQESIGFDIHDIGGLILWYLQWVVCHCGLRQSGLGVWPSWEERALEQPSPVCRVCSNAAAPSIDRSLAWYFSLLCPTNTYLAYFIGCTQVMQVVTCGVVFFAADYGMHRSSLFSESCHSRDISPTIFDLWDGQIQASERNIATSRAYWLDFKTKPVAVLPCTRCVIFFSAVGALDDGTPSFATQTTPLLNTTKMIFYQKRYSNLTAIQRWRGTALIPSARRKRAESVYVTSGMKTEQRTWTQPCPSVGLHARKKLSGGGQTSCDLRSVRRRGHNKQSEFWTERLDK